MNKTICVNSKGGRGGIQGLQPSVQDRVYFDKGVSFAIATSFMPSILISNDQGAKMYRIRKLTPRECWRLMGFSIRNDDGTWNDECFEKAEQVNSNAQLYKQAGNSIVVDCLEHIFRNLPLETNVPNERCVKCNIKIPKDWSVCPICGGEIKRFDG